MPSTAIRVTEVIKIYNYTDICTQHPKNKMKSNRVRIFLNHLAGASSLRPCRSSGRRLLVSERQWRRCLPPGSTTNQVPPHTVHAARRPWPPLAPWISASGSGSPRRAASPPLLLPRPRSPAASNKDDDVGDRLVEEGRDRARGFGLRPRQQSRSPSISAPPATAAPPFDLGFADDLNAASDLGFADDINAARDRGSPLRPRLRCGRAWGPPLPDHGARARGWRGREGRGPQRREGARPARVRGRRLEVWR
jgi:hypothetical protein